MPHKIFTSYSHHDEKLKHELDKHLAPLLLQGRVEAWSDRHIRAGGPLYEAIKDNIRAADIILMLISADYVSSKSCQDEMAIALERSSNKEAVAIPIIVRACDWTGLPIGQLLSANRDGKPINSAPDHDVAWYEVAVAIREILNDWDIVTLPHGITDNASGMSDSAEDELEIQPTASGKLRQRWINRKEENDVAWFEVKATILESLNTAAEDDPEATTSLQARRWGEKIIVDYRIIGSPNPIRIIIADIGGISGYPGYQLEVYPRYESVQLPSERVRWLKKEDGTRVLKRLRRVDADGGDEFTPADYAVHILNKLRSVSP